MNVANIELSKVLYELSGWGDTDFVYYSNAGKVIDQVFHKSAVFDKPTNVPAYDSGYLLRKLPETTSITVTVRANKTSLNLGTKDVYYARWKPAKGGAYDIAGNTPEDALAELACELIRQGILPLTTKEEERSE